LYVDARPGTHVDMDDLDAAGPKWTEQLALGPRLQHLAHRGAAAAQIEQRGQALGGEPVERTAQPVGFGFEHRVAIPPLQTASPCRLAPDRKRAASEGRCGKLLCPSPSAEL